ncbi:Uncharacterised protein [Klebsiella pneumoniae]|nr:Uncharacterised protein [Klebsiella pneumoniae]VTM03217.1 Uncharacterised protein [Klebsiella pneumoniae]
MLEMKLNADMFEKLNRETQAKGINIYQLIRQILREHYSN